MPLILYRPKKNLLALFATGVSNAHVSLIGRHLQFCKSYRSSAMVEPTDHCSSLPSSPRSDASFWNKSQMHNVIDQASQTPESARTSANQPATPAQCWSGPEALQFGPTLGQDEVARSSVQVNEPIRVSSSGCKGYWTNANAALEAVIERSCPGLRSSRPRQALRQLCAVIYNFFSQPLPPHRSGTTRQPTSNSTTLRTLHKKLRDLRREWRQRSGEPAAQT